MSLRSTRCIESVCTYCGVGCDIAATISGDHIVKIEAKKEGCVSQGKLCVKGKNGWDFLYSAERIRKPRIKKLFVEKNRPFLPQELLFRLSRLEEFDDNFYESPFDLACDLAAWKLSKIKKEHGPGAYAAIGGARTSCESAYLFQKFTREVVGSPHIDNCARVCHSPSLKGMRTTIGEGAATNPFDDIYEAEFIIVIGSNTTEGHPIVANRILDVASKGVELAVIDVRQIALGKFATHNVLIPFEANLMVLNMMAHTLIKEDLVDHAFIAQRTRGFESFREQILNDPYADPDFFAKLGGYEKAGKAIKAIARQMASKKTMILWGLGVTEHIDGSYAVMAITHLAMMTGNIGKKGAGLIPLRGQNNVQGACDMGCLPYFGPDYTKPKQEGMMTPDIIDAMLGGKIRALYNIGEDIAHIHPNQNKIHQALSNLDLLIVNELFDNEITRFADIVFGVKSTYEKMGVYVNAERRLHLSSPLIPSDLPDDWEVIAAIAAKMGKRLDYENSGQIWDEVRKNAPERFAGASYEKLEANRLRGLQWPVGKEDTPVLHTGSFRTKDGRGVFCYQAYRPRGMVQELLDGDFGGFYLTTGRVITHYNNAAQTKRCEKLIKRHDEDVVLASLDDRHFFEGLHKIVLVSAYGRSGPLEVKLSKGIKKGTLFCTFHHAKSRINFLFGDEADSFVKTARFKSIKVSIEPQEGF